MKFSCKECKDKVWHTEGFNAGRYQCKETGKYVSEFVWDWDWVNCMRLHKELVFETAPPGCPKRRKNEQQI
jgi:hypothetical protein